MLTVNNLSYKINGITLQNINFCIKEHSFCVMFGKHNSGKTELANIIMGLSPKYQGDILYKGKNIKKINSKMRKEIRFVPDEVLLFPKLKVKTYLNYIEKTYHIQNSDYRHELLEYFPIDENQYVTNMTYEENKLVAIIGALLTNPQLLILDEPSKFLTSEMFQKLLEYLQKLNNEGLTILILTETFEETEPFTGSYLYLKDGQLKKSGIIDKTSNRTKKITIKQHATSKLEQIFGKAIDSNPFESTYYTNLDWEQIGTKLKNCNIADTDIFIQTASMDMLLDISCELEKKDEEIC